VIDAEQNHHSAEKAHDDHPGVYHADRFLELPGEKDKSALRKDLCDIVECTLPSHILRLLFRCKSVYIDPVGGYIVSRAVESYDGHQGDGVLKEGRKSKTEGEDPEADPPDELSCDNEILFRLEHLKDRAPQRFESPG
jgi:hypothetical protein